MEKDFISNKKRIIVCDSEDSEDSDQSDTDKNNTYNTNNTNNTNNKMSQTLRQSHTFQFDQELKLHSNENYNGNYMETCGYYGDVINNGLEAGQANQNDFLLNLDNLDKRSKTEYWSNSNQLNYEFENGNQIFDLRLPSNEPVTDDQNLPHVTPQLTFLPQITPQIIEGNIDENTLKSTPHDIEDYNENLRNGSQNSDSYNSQVNTTAEYCEIVESVAEKTTKRKIADDDLDYTEEKVHSKPKARKNTAKRSKTSETKKSKKRSTKKSKTQLEVENEFNNEHENFSLSVESNKTNNDYLEKTTNEVQLTNDNFVETPSLENNDSGVNDSEGTIVSQEKKERKKPRRPARKSKTVPEELIHRSKKYIESDTDDEQGQEQEQTLIENSNKEIKEPNPLPLIDNQDNNLISNEDQDQNHNSLDGQLPVEEKLVGVLEEKPLNIIQTSKPKEVAKTSKAPIMKRFRVGLSKKARVDSLHGYLKKVKK